MQTYQVCALLRPRSCRGEVGSTQKRGVDAGRPHGLFPEISHIPKSSWAAPCSQGLGLLLHPHASPWPPPTGSLGLHILSLTCSHTWHDRMRNWGLAAGDGGGRQSLLVPITNGHLSEKLLGKDVAPEDLLPVDSRTFHCTLVRLLVNIIIILH